MSPFLEGSRASVAPLRATGLAASAALIVGLLAAAPSSAAAADSAAAEDTIDYGVVTACTSNNQGKLARLTLVRKSTGERLRIEHVSKGCVRYQVSEFGPGTYIVRHRAPHGRTTSGENFGGAEYTRDPVTGQEGAISSESRDLRPPQGKKVRSGAFRLDPNLATSFHFRSIKKRG
jgi:hypothetical protein